MNTGQNSHAARLDTLEARSAALAEIAAKLTLRLEAAEDQLAAAELETKRLSRELIRIETVFQARDAAGLRLDFPPEPANRNIQEGDFGTGAFHAAMRFIVSKSIPGDTPETVYDMLAPSAEIADDLYRRLRVRISESGIPTEIRLVERDADGNVLSMTRERVNCRSAEDHGKLARAASATARA